MHYTLKYFRFVVLLLSVLIWHGCYEDIEGCTDPLAENYRFNADVRCKDCCRYPELLVTLTHKWGDDIFQNNKQYINNVNNAFVINSHKFFLANINIYNANNIKIDNKALKAYNINNQEANIVQDFCLINGTLSDCRSGSYKHIGPLSSLTFNIALPTQLNSVDSISVSRDQNLSWNEGMYRDRIYQGIFLNITSVKNQSNYSLFLRFEDIISIDLDDFVHTAQGKTIVIPIVLDYEILFKDMDFTQTENVKLKLAENIKIAFRN